MIVQYLNSDAFAAHFMLGFAVFAVALWVWCGWHELD
jgi:hypothetical protein